MSAPRTSHCYPRGCLTCQAHFHQQLTESHRTTVNLIRPAFSTDHYFVAKQLFRVDLVRYCGIRVHSRSIFVAPLNRRFGKPKRMQHVFENVKRIACLTKNRAAGIFFL